ncbi:basic amino acid ABC transporter substrate-binding protein [Thermobispora bispora]|uniref:Extracellular solute-binding protein family 3 n=1 Tax=Thermobispora bispora (strain ATCC 19993 / DSM 43833 / CBS 139.67 / JCM 10125 / KCTC 9307 / NBRC 14880 / R51) TaxID=469371 RepID=D6Y3N1_THEBD|nr:ABC transporter substrate-binding protein [Thermobispora bispora]ADG87060.1 extracellular solute-binding protein family 3 [Thermobispora bispora DSM 43833]MDI9580842.1 ABC transporter substrate-binding protein [Thermobispora sp.]
MAPWSTYRRVAGIGATALITALMVAACGGGGDTTASSPSEAASAAGGVKLVNPGKLTTCTNIPYEPFQFQQGDKIVGFDVDIVDLVANKLGVQQEIVDIDFAAIKSGAALNAGKCDVAAAGMTITEERKQNLDFSVPYFDASQALMAKKGSGVTSLDDVKAKGLKLGAQASTTGLDYVKSQGFEPIEFADSQKQLNGLQAGRVDVIVQDLPVVLTWLKKPEISAEYEMVGSLDTGEQYGIGLKKGNTELLNVVNEVINQAKADGTYATIYKKWFGTEPPSNS